MFDKLSALKANARYKVVRKETTKQQNANKYDNKQSYILKNLMLMQRFTYVTLSEGSHKN